MARQGGRGGARLSFWFFLILEFFFGSAVSGVLAAAAKSQEPGRRISAEAANGI